MRLRQCAVICAALCVLQTGAAQAKNEEKIPDNPMNWEISAQPKPTAAELEEMRWSSVLENDTAKYECDAKSLKQDETDADLANIMIKATYKDRKMIDGLNRRYKEKLTDKDAVSYSEMRMVFRLSDRTYAIPAYKVYSKNGMVLEDTTREPRFAPVPPQTFAETMYIIVVKMLQENKAP